MQRSLCIMTPTVAVFLIVVCIGCVGSAAGAAKKGKVERELPASEVLSYEVKWSSEHQTVTVAGTPVTTTIKRLGRERMDKEADLETVAEIKLGDTPVAYFVLNCFDRWGICSPEESPKFLTPLFSSIRIGKVTPDKIKIGVMIKVTPVDAPAECKTVTYNIKDGKASKSIWGVRNKDCDKVLREYTASSSKYLET